VTISYRLVHPVTRLVGNGLVKDNAIDADEGRGRTFDRKESRCLRRWCNGDKTVDLISVLSVSVYSAVRINGLTSYSELARRWLRDRLCVPSNTRPELIPARDHSRPTLMSSLR